jgi:hypothetical protein
MGSAWQWLNGKKTVVASLCGLALSWAMERGVISATNALYLASALTVITGVAVGHKAVKAVRAHEEDK